MPDMHSRPTESKRDRKRAMKKEKSHETKEKSKRHVHLFQIFFVSGRQILSQLSSAIKKKRERERRRSSDDEEEQEAIAGW